MKVTAVIVAKKESERLANKNTLPFGYSSLLGHKIRQLKKCKTVDEVVVGSDCDDILTLSRDFGVQGVKRPDEYCDEQNCTANQMIGNMCSLISTDIVLWSHCTNPLIQPETYDEAVNLYSESVKRKNGVGDYYDSLISVDLVQEHFWQINKVPYPVYHNPYSLEHVLAKDLPKLYKQNGAIFIQSHEAMKENSYFYGKSPYLFVTPKVESLDINTEMDYKIAKYIYESFLI